MTGERDVAEVPFAVRSGRVFRTSVGMADALTDAGIVIRTPAAMDIRTGPQRSSELVLRATSDPGGTPNLGLIVNDGDDGIAITITGELVASMSPPQATTTFWYDLWVTVPDEDPSNTRPLAYGTFTVEARTTGALP